MSKTVLITGASSGIGFELSRVFARNGYNLVIVSQNKDNLEKAKSIISMENANSKAFVLHFSEGIREELKGTGVTVTTLCPGATGTNFAKRANIEEIKLFSGTLLDPKYVAEVGYRALMKNKSVVITGFYNKIVAQSIRLMPRSMVTKIGMNMMKK